jgi:DNA polymerase-3 subunit beta
VLLEQRDGSLYVTATDLEMQITAHSAMPGKDGQATTVGRRKLQDLLRALPDDATLNIDVGNNKMTVRAGRSRFNLQTLAAGDYPTHRRRHGAAADPLAAAKGPRALFKLVEFAMAQQDIRYYLNGMLLVLDKGTPASGGHRRPSPVRGPSIGVAGGGDDMRRQEGDPAAQDRARARPSS